jgi:hypothetical protein
MDYKEYKQKTKEGYKNKDRVAIYNAAYASSWRLKTLGRR